MHIYIGDFETTIYRWAQNRTWVSVLRDSARIFEITLVFAEDLVGEDYFRKYVFPPEWTSDVVEVHVTENIVTISVKFG